MPSSASQGGVNSQTVFLREHAYYRTGGTAHRIYMPGSIEELAQAVKDANHRNLPLILLGGGTNSLVMDAHFEGAVILFKNLQKLEIQETSLRVGAGVENSVLSQFALKHGLKGAAWMYRLPGQLGGTVRMNARCYNGEISQIVTRVLAVSKTGNIREYKDKSVFRGYKDTLFMETGDLIAEVEIKLTPGDQQEIERFMIGCETDRSSKGQFLWPSCGCVFKNDYSVGVPSGMLLEASGAKAMRLGGAQVSQYHANFVYNVGATSREILEITLKMREEVYKYFGVWLEYEMEVLGSIPEDLKAAFFEKRPSQANQGKLKDLRQRFKSR